MYSWFRSRARQQQHAVLNTTVDSLLEDARVQSDQNQATAITRTPGSALDDSSYVFINHGVAVQATTTKVHNFLLMPTTIMFFSQVWLA